MTDRDEAVAYRLRVLAGWMRKYERSGGHITSIEVEYLVSEMDGCADALHQVTRAPRVRLRVIEGGALGEG